MPPKFSTKAPKLPPPPTATDVDPMDPLAASTDAATEPSPATIAEDTMHDSELLQNAQQPLSQKALT
jgi:hypothetical protein